MAFLANTRLTVMRGTAVDDYDDVVDTTTPVAADVPAFLVSNVKQVRSPETGRIMSVTYADCMIRFRVDVQQNDRVRDQSSDLIWVVDQVTDNKSFIQGDKRLKLRQLDS